MRKPGSLESWEVRRNIAIDMHEQGHPTAAIAAALGVCLDSIYQWLSLYRRGGREALRSKKPAGRKPRLGAEQKRRLGELLLQTPQELGFAGRYLWTQQLIADLIEREFGVKYHHDRVGRILKAMDFTHQKPARRARERDEAKVGQWRAEAWPALLKKVSSPTA